MKISKRKKLLVAMVILLAVGVIAGPVVKIDDSITAVTLPDDLDRYVQRQEQRYGDIVAGTEKTIHWADEQHRLPTPVSIVYLHGYTASRQELAPVCDIVARQLGANVFYQRFTGHGRGSEAMAGISVHALLNDAYQALEIGKRIGRKVILIGNSTGGTLASIAAARDKSSALAALVLVSPNFGPRRKESELLLLPWGNVMLQLVEGSTYSFDTYNEQHARYWTSSFPSKALMPMMGAVKLARDTDVTKIITPLLVMFSPDDAVVSVEAIKEQFRRFGARHKQIHAVRDSADPQHHVLAGDILSPQTTLEVAQVIIDFVQPLM